MIHPSYNGSITTNAATVASGATLTVEKGVGAKYVELKISDRLRKLQPEFVVRVWE